MREIRKGRIHDGREAKRAQNAARHEEFLKKMCALSPEDQQIITTLMAITDPTCQRVFNYPSPIFFQKYAIGGFDEKRLIYVLWTTGLFTEIPDVDEIDSPLNPLRMHLEGFVGLCRALGMRGGRRKLFRSLERLRKRIPGFSFEWTLSSPSGLERTVMAEGFVKITYFPPVRLERSECQN